MPSPTADDIPFGLFAEAYPIKSVCFFCGSAANVRPSYIQSGIGKNEKLFMGA
jgi:hypothetical protein